MKNFQWRDKNGNLISPEAMGTTHLFYTIKLAWNHHVEEYKKIHPYKEYNLGDEYPKAYLKQAVWELLSEYKKRDDTPAEFDEDIAHITKHINMKKLSVDTDE